MDNSNLPLTPGALSPFADLDWGNDEAVVRAAIPDAVLMGGHHGKVWIVSATCQDSYVFNGMISQVHYLGTRNKRRSDAWADTRENSPTVQAFERAHNPAYAKPVPSPVIVPTAPPAMEEVERPNLYTLAKPLEAKVWAQSHRIPEPSDYIREGARWEAEANAALLAQKDAWLDEMRAKRLQDAITISELEHLRNVEKGLREKVEADLVQLKADHDEWIEREAACCPEDTRFDVLIATLRKRVEELESDVARKSNLIGNAVPDLSEAYLRAEAAESSLAALKAKMEMEEVDLA